MPVEDAIIMTILPDDGQCIRTDCHHIRNAGGRRVAKLDVEHVRIGFGFHILMSTTAGGTWAGGTQQLKWINARMIVVPCDCEFFGLFIGSNTGWFFVHYLPLVGEAA